MMETELLRTFLAVVDTGSFTRAARQIFRTQAAVSQQMKRLEQTLGKTLFEREGRVLELTQDGKALTGYARRIVNLHDEAMQQLQQEEACPPLRLGCPDDYLHTVVPGLLALIEQRFPKLEVQIFGGSTNRLRPQLDAGELHLSVMTRHPGSDEGYTLFQDQGVWVIPEGMDPEKVEVLPLALSEPDCKFYSTAIDGLEKLGRHYQVRAVVNNTALLAELVRRNGMVSAMVTSGVPAGLTTLEAGTTLPDLPSVAIVMAMAAKGHPLVTAPVIQQICQAFRSGAWNPVPLSAAAS